MLSAYGLSECYDFSSPLPDKKSGFKGVWYVAERAKSGRSECRCCRTKIANATLRIGVSQDCSFEQRGASCGFFHPTCFFKVTNEGKEYWARKVTSTDQIQNFGSLSPAHKSEIQGFLGKGGGKISTTAVIAAPPSPKNSKNVLFYYSTSEGGFVAIGNTRPVKDYLRDFNGRWDYAGKHWLFDNADDLTDLLGGKPQKSADWKKEMTINAIEIAAEGEDSDESDYEEDSDDEEEEDSDDEEEEDSDDEEEEDGDMKMGGGWGAAKPVKKSYPKPAFSSSSSPSPSFPLPKQKAPSSFSLSKATNFDFNAAPTPILPTTVQYPKVKAMKHGAGGGGKMEVCQEPLPVSGTSGMFTGKYVYFVPGCSFFTPTAHLKKSVRDNGGVIVYNPSVATTIVCNKQQRGAWGGGGLSGGVMVVADNWITNAVSRGSLSSWR